MSGYQNAMPYYGTDSQENINTLFRKVYQYMALGLILTTVVAYYVASSTDVIKYLFSSSTPLFLIAILEVGLVIWLSAGLNKMSASTALILFGVYSVLNGVLCSSVLLVYTQESVYKAFLSTAGMFGAMSIYGLYTKRDLTGLGSFLRMGLIGLLIAIVINLFLGSSRMELYISVFGIIIFLGLTVYDTYKIKNIASEMDMSDPEVTGRIAVIGALNLYLDFINIFLYLLRLFGKERN